MSPIVFFILLTDNPRKFNKTQITETNGCVKKEHIFIGDWCLLYFQERWLIGVILSFCYLNQKTFRAQEYVFSSVKINEIRQKPVGVLCTLYQFAQDGQLNTTYANEKAVSKHGFIPIDSYKATIAPPEFNNNNLILHAVVITAINNFQDIL